MRSRDTSRGIIVSILKFIYSDLENKIIDHKPILYLNYTLISLDTMINTHKNGFIFAKTQPSKVCWCVDCKNREKKIEFQFKQILNRWYNNRLSLLMMDTWHGDLTGACLQQQPVTYCLHYKRFCVYYVEKIDYKCFFLFSISILSFLTALSRSSNTWLTDFFIH